MTEREARSRAQRMADGVAKQLLSSGTAVITGVVPHRIEYVRSIVRLACHTHNINVQQTLIGDKLIVERV